MTGDPDRIAGQLDELLARQTAEPHGPLGPLGSPGSPEPHGPPGSLASLVEAVLRGLAEGRLVVPAVRHPLGFLYAPLRRTPAAVLRLHLWPARPHWRTLTTSPYHMHAWDLVSYVHRGTVRNTTVEVVPCAQDEPDGFRLFEVRGEGGQDRLAPTDRTVRISRRTEELLPAGSVYRLGAGILHTTALTGPGGAATLARVTPVPGTRERVLGPHGLGRHTTTRAPSPPDEVADTARSLLAP
ncbi:hypothetical protein ACFYU9_18650 [Streptomyces sp. NPDC004327]|uniref:hypothetical protein n=1 Tax=Streptomyces sp. NPDC004327 TaxID=3364699 RepID=UPI0036B1344C